MLDRFRAAHPSVEIKLSTGDAADAMEKVVTGEADRRLPVSRRLCRSVAFSMLENLAVVLIAPAPCPVRNQVTVERPDWSTVPFIMADQGRYVGASSCGFGGIKSAIRRSTPPSAGTKRWCRWSPWMRRGAAAGSGAGEQSGAGTQQGDDPGAQR
ncbi:hypothetical protein M3O75_26435 [Klebsiella pneumoniae]|nr:hypothetical protein [Klebsiella pneumoniae]